MKKFASSDIFCERKKSLAIIFFERHFYVLFYIFVLIPLAKTRVGFVIPTTARAMWNEWCDGRECRITRWRIKLLSKQHRRCRRLASTRYEVNWRWKCRQPFEGIIRCYAKYFKLAGNESWESTESTHSPKPTQSIRCEDSPDESSSPFHQFMMRHFSVKHYVNNLFEKCHFPTFYLFAFCGNKKISQFQVQLEFSRSAIGFSRAKVYFTIVQLFVFSVGSSDPDCISS